MDGADRKHKKRAISIFLYSWEMFVRDILIGCFLYSYKIMKKRIKKLFLIVNLPEYLYYMNSLALFYVKLALSGIGLD